MVLPSINAANEENILTVLNDSAVHLEEIKTIVIGDRTTELLSLNQKTLDEIKAILNEQVELEKRAEELQRLQIENEENARREDELERERDERLARQKEAREGAQQQAQVSSGGASSFAGMLGIGAGAGLTGAGLAATLRSGFATLLRRTLTGGGVASIGLIFGEELGKFFGENIGDLLSEAGASDELSDKVKEVIQEKLGGGLVTAGISRLLLGRFLPGIIAETALGILGLPSLSEPGKWRELLAGRGEDADQFLNELDEHLAARNAQADNEARIADNIRRLKEAMQSTAPQEPFVGYHGDGTPMGEQEYERIIEKFEEQSSQSPLEMLKIRQQRARSLREDVEGLDSEQFLDSNRDIDFIRRARELNDIQAERRATSQTPAFNLPSIPIPGPGINNPFNIRDMNQNWQGQVGATRGFVDFDSPEYGIRAADRLLAGPAYAGAGLSTITDVITKFAPPEDNNPTERYIRFVSQQTGIGPNEQIDLNDPNTRAKLLSAMGAMESQFRATPEQIRRAVSQVDPDVGRNMVSSMSQVDPDVGTNMVSSIARDLNSGSRLSIIQPVVVNNNTTNNSTSVGGGGGSSSSGAGRNYNIDTSLLNVLGKSSLYNVV